MQVFSLSVCGQQVIMSFVTAGSMTPFCNPGVKMMTVSLVGQYRLQPTDCSDFPTCRYDGVHFGLQVPLPLEGPAQAVVQPQPLT